VNTIIGYWKSSIPGQHFTYAKNSFFAHYAFCHALNKLSYLKVCEEYYKAKELFNIDIGLLTYSQVKNAHEDDPIACVQSDLWRNVTTESAIYVSYLRRVHIGMTLHYSVKLQEHQ
jgi:hypothetical protein